MVYEAILTDVLELIRPRKKRKEIEMIYEADLFQDLLQLKQDEDGTWIASEDRTGVYGEGDSLSAAIKDYVISLIEYSELLLRRTVCPKQPTL